MTYRYHLYVLSNKYNFYPTLHPKVHLINIQYKMFTPMNTGVHRPKLNQACPWIVKGMINQLLTIYIFLL